MFDNVKAVTKSGVIVYADGSEIDLKKIVSNAVEKIPNNDNASKENLKLTLKELTQKLD